MRLFVQRFPAIGVNDSWAPSLGIQSLDFRRNIKKALCTQEKPIFGSANAFCDPDVFVKRRMGDPGAKTKILRPAFRVEAARYGNCLKQSGLSGPILTDEKGDVRVKWENIKVPDGR